MPNLTFAISLLLASASIPWNRAHPYENSKPEVADIQLAEAWERDIGSTENELKLIRVTNLHCTNIPVGDFKPNDLPWNVEAVARCQYKVALDTGRSWGYSERRTKLFTYKRHGCGDQGQEADLWCFFWHIKSDE